MVRPPRPQPQTPVATVTVDVGSAGALDDHLIAVCFEERVNRPSRCWLELDDWDPTRQAYRYSETPAIDFGVPLSLDLMAGSGALERVFDGRIYGMSRRLDGDSPPVLMLEAFDRLQDLAMTRRARHFEETTVDDVLAAIAQDHGLQADLDLGGASQSTIVQANESDLDVVLRLLEEVDGEVWIAEGRLRASRHETRPGETIELRPQRDLFDLRIDADLTSQREELSVSGWDVVGKQSVSASADPDSLPSALGGLLSGGGLLGHFANAAEERLVHRMKADDESAQSLARSRYARLSRGFVTLRAVARGNARLRVGSKIDLSGAGLRFDGRYVVAVARHRVDAEAGYRCEIEARRSGVGR